MSNQKELNFNFTNIREYLIRQQTNINVQRAYYTSWQEAERKSKQAIEAQNLLPHFNLENKKLRKQLETMMVLPKEAEISSSNLQQITTKFIPWLNERKKQLQALKEQLDGLERKRIKKQLQLKEVEDFRTELKAKMLQYHQFTQTSLKVLAKNNIKNNAQLLEAITHKMSLSLSS